MRKKVLLCCMLLVLCGCSKNVQKTTGSKEYATTSFIEKLGEKNINSSVVGVELVQPYTPEYMKSISDHIVLATIVSIDSSDMKNNSVVGSTYGTLFVQDTSFGESVNGQLLSYIKHGCFLKTMDYEAAQPKEAQEKLAYLREQSNTILTDQDYADILTEGDIHIETQKSYLLYLKYNKDLKIYEIIGLGNGLRELNTPLQTKAKSIEFDISSLEIKDNTTGQYVNLKNYIDTEIK